MFSAPKHVNLFCTGLLSNNTESIFQDEACGKINARSYCSNTSVWKRY